MSFLQRPFMLLFVLFIMFLLKCILLSASLAFEFTYLYSHVSIKVKRRQWKLELINDLTRLTTAEPIPLPIE